MTASPTNQTSVRGTAALWIRAATGNATRSDVATNIAPKTIPPRPSQLLSACLRAKPIATSQIPLRSWTPRRPCFAVGLDHSTLDCQGRPHISVETAAADHDQGDQQPNPKVGASEHRRPSSQKWPTKPEIKSSQRNASPINSGSATLPEVVDRALCQVVLVDREVDKIYDDQCKAGAVCGRRYDSALILNCPPSLLKCALGSRQVDRIHQGR